MSTPEAGATGVCRTCGLPIWWEVGTLAHRAWVGWSDRIERGGDSIVCFKAWGFRHAPLAAPILPQPPPTDDAPEGV